MLIAIRVLLPILFTIALGFVFEKWRSLDAKTLSAVVIHVLTPCLVFHSLLTARMSHRDLTEIVLFLPLLTVGLWAFTKGILKARRDPPSAEGAVMLCSLFMNAGNFGIPMCQSAFGPAGVAYGAVWVVIQNTLLFPPVIYFAAKDARGTLDAMREIVKLPVIYAALVAVTLRLLGVAIPGAMMEPIRSIGYAMIPVSQLLLGAQLAKTAKEVRWGDFARLGMVIPIRLIASPLLAVPLSAALGATGLTRSAMILLSGTPTAVTVSVMALEFDNDPHFVSAAVFCSTVLSFVTLGVTLYFLR